MEAPLTLKVMDTWPYMAGHATPSSNITSSKTTARSTPAAARSAKAAHSVTVVITTCMCQHASTSRPSMVQRPFSSTGQSETTRGAVVA